MVWLKNLLKNKKAQRGGQFEDYSETNRYTGKGFPARFMSAAYEAQPFVKAKKAEDLRRSKMTQEQRDLEKLNLERTRIQNEKDQQMRDRLNRGGGNQRRGGKTIKRVTKAQNGTKKETEAQRMQREADEKMKRWQTNRPDTLAPGDKAERAAWIYKKVQQAQQNAPKQKRGGVTRKAQTGAKTKAQMGVRTKAQYGTARKSSSRRSK